ncbi:hypothetical protein E4H12_06765 [Candidatus Thorarchaeota archaeon]|nr:MAG: hypothetical protein E4H12_06765 [Candidatus Thorarchaeota archaeon]
MDDLDDMAEISQKQRYTSEDSAAVFRVAWYAIASKPNVLLEEHNEAESTSFQGDARFSLQIAGEKAFASIRVDAEGSLIELHAKGKDEVALKVYLDDIMENLEESINKFQALPEEDKSKLRRALVANTCWDMVIYKILKKAPLSEVYYQIAHGREMMIKATEGDVSVNPLLLTTSGWLSNIESLPREQALPGNIASELAKKSIEWKRGTHEVISRYL